MSNPVQILLIEDDAVEVESIMRSFRKHQFGNPVIHVNDGIEALQVLRGLDEHKRLLRPYIILLDIGLPRMSGIEFLQVLRQDPKLRWSVVFVLTISAHYQDIIAAYNEYVAGYILKDRVSGNYEALIKLLDCYQAVVTLPA